MGDSDDLTQLTVKLLKLILIHLEDEDEEKTILDIDNISRNKKLNTDKCRNKQNYCIACNEMCRSVSNTWGFGEMDCIELEIWAADTNINRCNREIIKEVLKISNELVNEYFINEDFVEENNKIPDRQRMTCYPSSWLNDKNDHCRDNEKRKELIEERQQCANAGIKYKNIFGKNNNNKDAIWLFKKLYSQFGNYQKFKTSKQRSRAKTILTECPADPRDWHRVDVDGNRGINTDTKDSQEHIKLVKPVEEREKGHDTNNHNFDTSKSNNCKAFGDLSLL